MTELVLNYARDDAKTVVKASMEYMSSVDTYADEGQRIVGKQEASIMGGNGARLLVDVPETTAKTTETVIEVSADKEVPIDMATNEEDIKSEFLQIVNRLRGKDVDTVLDEMSREMVPSESKEVASAGDFGNTQSTMGKRFVITFVIILITTLLFGVAMTSMMMP